MKKIKLALIRTSIIMFAVFVIFIWLIAVPVTIRSNYDSGNINSITSFLSSIAWMFSIVFCFVHQWGKK